MVRIPRHLVEVHGWAKEYARTALVRFGLRKTYGYSSPSKVPQKKKKTTEEKETFGSQEVSMVHVCVNFLHVHVIC